MKFLKRILITGLALTCALLSACSFTFEAPDLSGISSLGSGCARPVRPQETPVEQIEEFTLDFSEEPKTLLIFPRITGYMIREEVPDKITVLCLERNYEDEIEIASLSFENGAYNIGFDENFYFENDVHKGQTLTFKLCVYNADVKTVLASAQTFTSHGQLFWVSRYSMTSFEPDENELPMMPIWGLDNEDYWTDWV